MIKKKKNFLLSILVSWTYNNNDKNLIHSIKIKFVNIKVKCKCVLCGPNFEGKREGKKLMNMLFY